MTKQSYKNDNIIMRTIEELVPKDHLVRKLEACMNSTFIEDEVKDLYSKFGRPSIPPIVLFKMLILNKKFGINSMRRTCEEIEVNLAYRQFLGLSIDDKVPNYSTWSQNYIRRYKDSEIFQTLFDKVLNQAIDYGFVDVSSVFGDCKEQTGLRFTRVRVLKKNEHNSTIIFTCQNLKKMALWSQEITTQTLPLLLILLKILLIT